MYSTGLTSAAISSSTLLKKNIHLMLSHLMFVLILFTQVWMNVLCGEKLALLSATLRTYQKAACDTDQIAIACPRGTSISIEFAQYNKFIAKDGISLDELCSVSDVDEIKERSRAQHLLHGSIFGSSTQTVLPNRYANSIYSREMVAIVSNDINEVTNNSNTSRLNANNNDDKSIENCQWPNSLQYSLLQTVVEACQKKKHCKFSRPQFYGIGASGVGDTSGTSSYYSSTATSKTLNVDPCLQKRKIVEVAYKCRPYEFRSKVACHNDVAQLECNPYSRIAVYSASFGRTEYESIQCPQPQGVREETCLASYSTETVMQICHGRRRCNLAADANTFGSPCQPNSKMYLKVVYTCVPKQVLMERYESEMEADEAEYFDGDMNDLYDDEYYKESEAIPKLYSNTTPTAARSNVHDNRTLQNSIQNILNRQINVTIIDNDGSLANPVMTHSADLILKDNQERILFYLLSAGSVGAIVCVVVVLARFIALRRDTLIVDNHLTTNIKGSDMEIVRTGDNTIVNVAIGETVIPTNVFSDLMPEINADINLVAMSVPSVSKNENYVNYAATSTLYGLCNNLLTQSGTIIPNVASSAMRGGGSIQSPDILNASATSVSFPMPIPVPLSASVSVSASASAAPSAISSQKYASAHSTTNVSSSVLSGILTPAMVISSAGCSTISSSTIIGTVVPITSLGQYTTAPTFRSGCVFKTENIIQCPPNTMPSTMSLNQSGAYLNLNQKCFQQQPQQQKLLQATELGNNSICSSVTTIAANVSTATTAVSLDTRTLRHLKSPTILRMSPVLHCHELSMLTMREQSPSLLTQKQQKQQQQQQQQPPPLSYDGTLPRTLSTGMPSNSQFYYD